MGKIKIYEIAKELNINSKEIIEIAQKLNIEIKSHLSGIDVEEAEKIKNKIKENAKKHSKQENKKESKKEESKESMGKEVNKKDNKKATKKEENKNQEKQPVIIRREVIIAKENEPKKEQNKNKSKSSNIGFVERKNSKDYNLVYRNKPNKPMSVSELFGLNKQEEQQKDEEKQIEEAKPVTNKQEETEKVIEPEEKVTIKNENNNNHRNVDGNKHPNNNRPFNRNNGNNYNNRNNNYNNRNNNYNNNGNNNNYNNGNNNNYNNYNNRKPNNGNNNNYNNNYNNRNSNNGNNNYNNSNSNYNNRNNQNRNEAYNNNRPNNNGNRYPNKQRPLDNYGIEKNIKNIIETETIEKESVTKYNRTSDKQRQNNNSKYEENKSAKKAKSRRGEDEGELDERKLKNLKQTDKLSNMFNDQEGGMLDYYDLTTARGRRGKKKGKNSGNKTKQKIFKLTEITIPESVTVKDFAAEIKKTTSEVIKKLLGYGILATINNNIDFDTAFLIAEEFGITAKKKKQIKEEDILFDDSEDKEEELQTRPPVVVVMGHVDHGKTSLLDAVKKTNVIEGEAGGITQHIGAYKVKIEDREITFLDTPGHEAFTAMRARGAQITDIAILVVAANDGVKPQTIEAINHAKSAGIPIIVAINKIDLPDANIEKVKQELMAYELVPEEWGGDTIFVPISAKQNQNIDQLLEMVLLEADVLELKTNPKKQAKGVVIEARLDKSKGAVATLLVQRGTLDVGDTVVVGDTIGRIRAMRNDKGKKVKTAGPSTPVSIMGLTDVPEGGDTFYEVKDEKMAKHLIDRRKRQAREKSINEVTKVTLDNLFSQMEEGKLKVLNLIVKADVQGSVEAVKQSLEKLQNEEVKVKVIHAAAGAVNQSDVTLAKVSNAIIIAFNVRPDATAKDIADKDEVEIKQYSVIYQAIEDVEAAMKGMLDPKYEEKVIGNAEVRDTFRISNIGTIAGCFVINGKVERNAGVRIIRENVVIHEGKISTLKRFKDDAKEVSKGFECGMQIENYNDIKEGDIIEAFVMEEIKR